ncbi:hypothetical protein [Dactylosporangium sp. CA-139066]|uniref:hypothetical protein n=1 Tax=Dactylosporangium sp. CA-139066 TaxID=3239930 RepID=UPI003D8D0093
MAERSVETVREGTLKLAQRRVERLLAEGFTLQGQIERQKTWAGERYVATMIKVPAAANGSPHDMAFLLGRILTIAEDESRSAEDRLARIRALITESR